MEIETIVEKYEDRYLNMDARLVKKGKDIFLELTSKPEFDNTPYELWLLPNKTYTTHGIIVTTSSPLELDVDEIKIKPINVHRDEFKLTSSCQNYPLGFKLKKEEGGEGLGTIEVEVFNGADRVAYLALQPKKVPKTWSK